MKTWMKDHKKELSLGLYLLGLSHFYYYLHIQDSTTFGIKKQEKSCGQKKEF